MNQQILIYVLISIVILLVIIDIVVLVQMKKISKSYERFMRGKNAASLESTLIGIADDITDLQNEDRDNKIAIRELNKDHRASFQKLGLVKYNAFQGMGGNLSFCLAILDYDNTGIILTVMHASEGSYVYVKQVEKGSTEVLLGAEEKEALERALGYK